MNRRLKVTIGAIAVALGLGGCDFTPYDIPLPGGADTGSDPYQISAEFRDVLDLVPQSGVRVNDIPVGKVKDIRLDGWNAVVTLEINRDAKLPDNAIATIRQTSLLGEKFVSLAPPKTGATGRLANGDKIPLARSGRNPEIEEVLSAASLLFNGGGIERTNTIVKELNQTLAGNEPEIKELLGTTDEFLGQLDDNKAAIITSLEKVDRLAVATNDQRDAITGALDNLPEALRVVNGQRDDLVKLLQALNRLGDVATGVIQQSKADTVADLKLLTPTLTNLSTSADDLAYDFKALLSYPFTDGAVGQVPSKVTGTCNNSNRDKNTGFCVGDYANLSVQLDIDANQVENLLGFDLEKLLSLGQAAPAADATKSGPAGLPDDAAGVPDLQKALEGMKLPGFGAATKKPAKSGSTPKPGATASPTKGGGDGMFCGLLGQCRAAAASPDGGSDMAAILLQPVVAP